MSDSRPNENRVRPARDKHAIEAVAIGVEWAPPLEQEAIAAAVKVHVTNPAVSERLPGKRVYPGIQFRVQTGAGANLAVEPKGELADFTHSNPDGTVDLTVSLRPDFFSCSSTMYTGWQTTKPLLLSLLTPFVRAVLPAGAAMQAIGLQYFDAFKWKKSLGNMLDQVVRADNQWLPKAAFLQPSLWHVHQGWFSDGPGHHRILNSMNIDLQEDGSDFVLRVHGQHKVQANQFVGGEDLKIGLEELETAPDYLHRLNLLVLNQLLTKDMRERIGLKEIEQV